jgi:hypothetical protein
MKEHKHPPACRNCGTLEDTLDLFAYDRNNWRRRAELAERVCEAALDAEGNQTLAATKSFMMALEDWKAAR